MGRRANTASILSMAHALCANWRGYCLLTRAGKCHLAGRKPCEHFEHTILPLASHAGEYAKYAGVPRAYAMTIGSSTPEAVEYTDRKCACGNPLPARKRMCEDCRKAASKAAKRKWWKGKPDAHMA